LVQNRRGRPRLKKKDRKSEPVGVRLTKELRDRLEDARRQGDAERSLTAEIELRLRESFEREKEIERRFGGPATARLLEIVADRIKSIEISTGGTGEPGGTPKLRWFEDRFTYDQVRSMIDVVLDHFRPPGRRTIPKAMRWHPSLKKDVENLGRHSALLALACLESAASFSKESDVPALYDRAALPLGRRLKGSPIDELSKDREQRRQRILKNPIKRNAAAEAKEARKVDALLARTVDVTCAPAVNALGSYLKPRLIQGAKVNIHKVFKGVTGANLAQQKAAIIERMKAATKGKLADPATSLDESDLGRLLDTAGKRETSDGSDLRQETPHHAAARRGR
jgi:hypothetical protein